MQQNTFMTQLHSMLVILKLHLFTVADENILYVIPNTIAIESYMINWNVLEQWTSR